jgi:hypothetical protein
MNAVLLCATMSRTKLLYNLAAFHAKNGVSKVSFLDLAARLNVRILLALEIGLRYL